MKKKLLTLTLPFAMALALSACGGQPVQKEKTPLSDQESTQTTPAEEDSDQESSSKENNPSESAPSKSEPSENGSPESSPEDSLTISQWYNSQNRAILESYINDFSEDSGMTFFITIEEPGTLIYNYQYTSQLDFSPLSQDEVAASYAGELDKGAAAILSDISNFQSEYGMPLTTIRMVYLNADGSLIYSQDFTEDYESPSQPQTSSAAKTLADWVESEEARQIADQINKQLESSGIKIELTSDDTVLCWDYYYTYDLGLENTSQEELDATFSPLIDSQAASLKNLFSAFESEYDMVLEGIRLSFYTEDGTLLYTSELKNE